MSRRRRDDHRSAGRSALIPFVPGEGASDRHARRLSVNVAEGRPAVEAWCQARGLRLRVNNGGHHWIIDRPGWRAEWWPSSAKLVIQQKWDRGVHVHDWQQALAIIERALTRCA